MILIYMSFIQIYTQAFLIIMIMMTTFWIVGAQYHRTDNPLGIFDFAGVALWIIGFTFEAVGDFQLALFKGEPLNKGKVMDKGFWHYTRHPNYFGDSAVWWGFGLICLASGSYLPALGSVLMTALIIKVSGVALLEKTLKEDKPQYMEYIEKTSSFIPWFPKK